MTEPTTIEVIRPCPDCIELPIHGPHCKTPDFPECPATCDGHEGAEVIEVQEVSQLELWHMATEGTPGDGTESTPTFYVARTGRALPVGMSPSEEGFRDNIEVECHRCENVVSVSLSEFRK